MIRIGVIGSGVMGTNHVRVLARQHNVKWELIGVCDVDEAKAHAVSEAYNTRAYSSIRMLLRQSDCVVIATPATTHEVVAKEVLTHRVPVLIEKPLGHTTASALRIEGWADAENVLVQVGHIERFNPVVTELQKILMGRRILAIAADRLSAFDDRIEVDVVHDLMLHDLDIVQSFIGQISLVGAVGSKTRSGSWDHIEAVGKGANDEVVRLSASRVSQDKVRHIQFTTDNMVVRGDLMLRSIQVIKSGRALFDYGSSSARVSAIVEKLVVPSAEPLELELAAFVQAVENQEAPRVSCADGVSCLRLADKISAMAR